MLDAAEHISIAGKRVTDMVRIPRSPLGEVLPRRAFAIAQEALEDTRVVIINGARQSGKSTLAAQLGAAADADWRTLDDPPTRQAAIADPRGFVESTGRMQIIDEAQRAPELLLAIKAVVDADPTPGQYLLTGSARVLAMRGVADALPGRTETIELWPLSQGEIDGSADSFIDIAFEQGESLRHDSELTRADYLERLVRGGFPGAIGRREQRRERFLDSYVADLVNRDVIQLSDIQRGPEMRALVSLLAWRSGQVLVPGALANELSLTRDTIVRYLSLLEEVFLIKRIPAWSRNLGTRATAAPKVAFVDSGLAANLLDQNEASLRRPDAPLGSLLEGFVAMELARQLTWSRTRAELSHYRTRDGMEVDIVLEDRRRRVVAIEVKAAATVRAEDFRGIRHLAARIGDDLVAGIVLYAGDRTMSFGDRLRAVPISALWGMD